MILVRLKSEVFHWDRYWDIMLSESNVFSAISCSFLSYSFKYLHPIDCEIIATDPSFHSA